MDAAVDVLYLVTGVVVDAAVAVAVVDLVKGAQDALDAEDLVLVHVHRKERVRLVPHAIVVLAVLVRVLHVHLVEDVLDQVDAEAVVDAMEAVMCLVKLIALIIAVAVVDLVNGNAQLDARDARDVLEAVVDALEAVVDALDADPDAMAHALAYATGVVMDAAVDVRMRVLLPAQRHVLAHAKLKRLVP